MPLMCIQCTMRALVKDEPPRIDVFEETMEEHMRRVHPDPIATQTERRELERLLAEKLKR